MRFTHKVEMVERERVSDGMGGWIDGEETITFCYGNLVQLDKLTVKKEYGIDIKEPAKLYVRQELPFNTPLIINLKEYVIQSALQQHAIKVYLLAVK